MKKNDHETGSRLSFDKDKPYDVKYRTGDSPEAKREHAHAGAREPETFPEISTTLNMPGDDKAKPAGQPYPTQQMGSHSTQALPDLNRHMWEKSKNAAWNEGPMGRMAIRVFSRGLMGAAFFTAGGLLTRKWMGGYDATKSLGQQNNPLQIIAKIIDSTAGKGIEKSVTAIAGKEAGLAAVRFRPTKFANFGREMRGRSLGDEAVNITFDFFAASVGDAWGRDIAAMIDPNAKKSWIDEKGDFHLSKMAKAAVNSAFRYVTYNGGEDWAVAVPYAYFMKAQRSMLKKANPGFEYDFDRSINGASLKVDAASKKVTGDYYYTGLLDLQTRFTAYNIGTLMYREVYDLVSNRVMGKKGHLYGSPEEDKSHHSIYDHIVDTGKWVARSAVKGAIIMTPAVPFFSITRTPQTRHRGLMIDPEHGTLGTPSVAGKKGDSLHLNHSDAHPDLAIDFYRYDPKASPILERQGRITNPGTLGQFFPNTPELEKMDAHQFARNPIKRGLNVIGKANHEVAHALTVPASWVDERIKGVSYPVKEFLGIKPDEMTKGRFVRPMAYAAISYTPYMYAKAEFANLWDNGKMDMAAERMIDGAFKLNWGEFKKGVGEVYRTVTLQPLADKNREAEGQRRMLLDTSPPDVFMETQAEQVATKHNLEPSNWRERVISAPKENKPIVKAKGGDGASLDDYKRQKVEKQADQLAEREALRKALEELHPPTNSIN